jgi:hypothetical protein
MGDVFNPVGISQADYASRPVNFYGEGLDTSIDVDTVDEQQDGANEVVSPNIYGDDDRGDSVAGQGQIIAGPKENLGKSVLQGAFASTKMYGVSDINLDSSAFKGTDLTKSPFSNYFDVASGQLTTVGKAIKDAGLGTPMADSIIKGRQSAVGLPGAMAPIMAAAGPITGIMGLATAAARAMQARDAASIMAANGKAGAMFDFNGMLLTRAPGSFQYTGNMQGYTTEQIKAIEAVKLGYIPGTFTETKVGDQWVQNGTKFMFGQTTDSVVAGRGTYDPNTGSFIGLDGSRAASGSLKSATELTNHINNTMGSSLKPSAVAQARSMVQRTGLFGLGGVKPGTKTFSDILRQMALESDYKNADTQKQAKAQKAKIESGQYTSTSDSDSFNEAFGGDGGSGGFTESDTGQISDAFGGGDAYGGTITHGRPQNRYVEGGSVDDAFDDDMGDVATMESSYSADPDAFADEDAGMYDSSGGGNDDNTIETIRQNILSAVSAKQLSKSDRKQLSEQMSVIGSRNKFNEAVKKEMDRFKSTEYKPSTINTREDVIGQVAKSSLRDIIANAPVIAAEGMALGPMMAAKELGITGRIDNALGISKALGIEPAQPMIGTDILTQMGFGQFVNPFKADGGRVGYAPGGDVGFAQRPEFVGGKQSQPDGVSVADDQPRDVQEGSFVINAAAADFAGRDDIEKMIRTAYKKVGGIGQTGQSQEVAINVSKGEVIIPAQLAKVIGYDRLNKINNRGKKEIARRQEKVEAAGGGFIQRKKFAEGDVVEPYGGMEVLNQAYDKFRRKFSSPQLARQTTDQIVRQLPQEDVLALLMMGEASILGDEGMRGVAHVAVNRTNSEYEDFSKLQNLYDVATQKTRTGIYQFNAFEPTTFRRTLKDITQTEYGRKKYERIRNDAEEILYGAQDDFTRGSLFFWNPKTSTDKSFKQKVKSGEWIPISETKTKSAVHQYLAPKDMAEGGFVVPKRKPKKEALADVELRADIEEFIQTDPLARLGWDLYEKNDVNMTAIVLSGREGTEVAVGGQYFPKEGVGKKSNLRKDWQGFIFQQNPNKRNILPENEPSITYLTGKADNYGRYDDINTMLHELRHHALRHMQSEYDVPLTSLPREETMMDFQDYANRKQARKVKESIPKKHTEKEKELRSKSAWMMPSVNRDVAKYQKIAEVILKERKVPPYKKPKQISSFMERIGNILGF